VGRVDHPRVLTAAALAVSGGGTWHPGPGTLVARVRRRSMLVFETVSDAVAAARRASVAGAAVGLAVGELSTGGDWWAGPPLEVADALALRAGAGRVLATATVRALAPRNGDRWVPAGLVDDATGGRVDVVELAGGDAPDTAVTAVPLPRLLALDAPFPFVPRDEPWAVLERAWAAGASGGRQLVLLGGGAGTGKTRLVTEFARHIHGRGGVVLYGGCSDRLAAPYQPFAEAVEHLVRSLAPGAMPDLVAAHAAELTRLAPAVAATLGSPQVAGADDPDTVRFRLFGAISALLGSVSARRPVLLVLDDLQWAGRPTVRMLDHLGRDSSLTRVVIVGVYRSVPAEVGNALREALPDLRRQPGVVRAALSEFDHEGIRRFVDGVAGREGGLSLGAVVDLLAAQTGGNAFLMGELWRHLVAAGYLVEGRGGWRLARPLDDVASPEGVREVVEIRLGGLPGETRRLLEVAAVAGTEFSAAVVADALGADQRSVLDALDPAVRAGLVEEAGAGEHRFAHALVRRSVVDNLGPAARRGYHLDLGRALERRNDDRSVSEIAHHLTAAVPLVEPDEVVDVARRAAAEATAAVAYDDAARHLEAVVPLVGGGRRRCELLLELADARMRAGDVAAALARCVECGTLAAEVGEPSLVVAAALEYDDANWRAALHGGVAEQLLRRALPLAPDVATEVRVQAALSRSLAFTGRGDEARARGDRALAAARDLGDHVAIRVAMSSILFAPWTAETIDHQVAIARELLERAGAEGNLEWETGALNKLLYGLINLGELDEARVVARRFRELTDRTGQPLFGVLSLQARALLAMGEGRFSEAEALADEANTLTTFLTGTDAEGGYGVQIFTLRREQGRLEEARPLVEAVARFGQEGATWRPALAVLYAELGRLDDAARELGHLVADDLRAVPRDSLYCGSLSYLTDAAVAVGDREAAALLYRELSPYRHLVVQVGSHLAAYGAADRYLGRLAALMGRVRDAETHFEAALRLDQRAHMPVWSAHSQLAYGRFLFARGRAGDRERAHGLLSSARETARSVGMVLVAEAAAAALDDAASRPVPAAASGVPDLPGAAAATIGLTGRELGVLRLLVDGHSNREIGDRLHISQHTAANHVRAILLKTGCANRTEAASWALRRGLIAD
jgi:DNA-binding CsgD family transcriptional regulator/tetratricopeptide (TPR) repeat protein